MKMLSIDGGGIRGVFPIAILQSIETELDTPVGELFDVIAGTSTGAIIASAAAMKIPMDQIMESYHAYGKKIFTRRAKVGFFESVYSDRYLRRLLQMAFDEKTLNEITKPLLIPAVDITHGKPFIYRSNFAEAKEKATGVKLWDAVLSSCSAPIYFPPNHVNDTYLSIDGGLWANNPSLVCITEAIHNFHSKLEEIEIMSIGTGQQKIDFTTEEQNWGIRQWLPVQFPSLKVTPKLLDLAMDLSSESISYHCRLLLGDHYLRLNERLSDEVPFDDVNCMEELTFLGGKAFSEKKQEIMDFIHK